MNDIDLILLRRKNKVVLPLNFNDETIDRATAKTVIAGSKNIEYLGYSLAPDVMKSLMFLENQTAINFFNDLISGLKVLRGADVVYNPMYKNFPSQVIAMNEVELYINAIIHYVSDGTLMPEYILEHRLPLIDDNKTTILTASNGTEITEILKNLLGSKTSLSNQDRTDVRNIMQFYRDNIVYMLPNEIPLKENVAFVANVILEMGIKDGHMIVAQYFKTATDVLRLIVAMSDGDISLATRTNFKHLNRPERRMIMGLLSNIGYQRLIEDFWRYHDEWIRIGEIIHVGEFKNHKYDDVTSAFSDLRNVKKPTFLMGKVECAIAANKTEDAANLLRSRPGEFARRLDKLIRDAKNPLNVIQSFESIADKVSSPVLLQVRQAFKNRIDEAKPYRVFFPKGRIAKAVTIDNELEAINPIYCKSIVRICENSLEKIYCTRDTMGAVYISDEFKKILVPFSQRSASTGSKMLVRGSRIPVKKGAKAVRGFIWWTNTKDSRVDIDLSACVLDENLNVLNHVSYTNLRNVPFSGYHSGDIVNGGPVNGNGVAEFLDVDVDKVAENGGRYICYQVYSFTNQKFASLPNCRFGWMEREDVQSGEIFEPSTVEMKIDLQSESTRAIPVLFDCVTKEFIWMDLTGGTESFRWKGNNIENNIKGVIASCWAMLNIQKTNMYELIALNAKSRGYIVEDRNKADIIFDSDTSKPIKVVEKVCEIDGNKHIQSDVVTNDDVPIITPYDLDYFMGKLL